MTPENVAELKQEFGQLANEFLTKVTKQTDEIKAIGVALPETKASIDKMNSRLDELETRLNRPPVETKAAGAPSDTLLAYSALMRYGVAELSHDEKKLLSIVKQRRARLDGKEVQIEETKVLTESDDTGGGYLAPPEFVTEIIKGVVLISLLRGVARVRTTSQRTVRIPKRTAYFTAVWANETSTRAETTGLTYGLEELPIHEMYALADISNQDLEDSAFDLNAELQSEFSEQTARAEGTAFIAGTGVGQPEGIMTNSAIAADVTGTSATLTYNGFVTLAHNLKSFYAQNAIFLMNRKTIGLARQIVDGNSRPIWMPFSQSGMDIANPPSILGSAYLEMPDMPDVGASTYPVAYGDFKRGYIIVDRISIEVQRDPYTQNTKGITRFIARKRVGGQVVLAEAIRKLECHT